MRSYFPLEEKDFLHNQAKPFIILKESKMLLRELLVWIPLKSLHTQCMHISLTKNFSVMDAYDHVAPSSWIFLNLKWYFKVWGIFYKYHGDLNSGPWSCEEGSLPLFYRCFLWDKWFKKEMSKKILDLYFFQMWRQPSEILLTRTSFQWL